MCHYQYIMIYDYTIISYATCTGERSIEKSVLLRFILYELSKESVFNIK